jgi:hypothetical protein
VANVNERRHVGCRLGVSGVSVVVVRVVVVVGAA